MRHDSKFSNWIRAGGQSAFVLNLNRLRDLKTKFSVIPKRLLDGIIDHALVIVTQRLNTNLPKGVSFDIQSVDLSAIRDRLRSDSADRLSEIGVAVNQNDPKITAIIARYAEILNGFFQTRGLQLESYVWRSRDGARVRSAHAAYDDQIFFRSNPPEGGHLGQGWNCRCIAEPIIDLEAIPEGATCDILTGDRLAIAFLNADNEILASIARELDLRIVSGQLDTRERLIHFLAQMRQEAGGDARRVEGLNYNPQGLRNTFDCFLNHPEDAERYGRTTIPLTLCPSQTLPTPTAWARVMQKAATVGRIVVAVFFNKLGVRTTEPSAIGTKPTLGKALTSRPSRAALLNRSVP